jgi:predicted transcriptional regulator
MDVATFTIRVDDELKTAFAAAAKAKDRTGGQLIRDFMREFVQRSGDTAAYDAWFRSHVEAGLADIEAGRVVSNEEVEAESAKWQAEVLQRAKKDER